MDKAADSAVGSMTKDGQDDEGEAGPRAPLVRFHERGNKANRQAGQSGETHSASAQRNVHRIEREDCEKARPRLNTASTA